MKFVCLLLQVLAVSALIPFAALSFDGGAAGSGNQSGRLTRVTQVESVAKGILKGTIRTPDGVPLSDGDVFFFNDRTGPGPLPELYWRVPDDFTRLDSSGRFSFELPTGRYYIGAIKRKDGSVLIGPPQPGDLFYAGTKLNSVLPGTDSTVDVIKDARPFSREMLKTSKKRTAIEGVVRDAAGKPIENVIVFAHLSPEMTDRPLYVSDRTDKSGSFSLRVAGSGTYFLRVRDLYGGGVPEVGSFMGVYGGDNPKGIAVRDGEVVGGMVVVGGTVLRQPEGK